MGNVTYSVLTYGRQDILIRCLQSFRKFHPDDPLIVTDNGGPEGDKSKIITEMYGGLYLNNPLNDSLSKIMNMGVEVSLTPYTCIVTNGVIFTKRLTEQFEVDFEFDSKIAMVGGLLFYPSGKIQHGGGFRRWNEGRMGHYGHGKDLAEAQLCTIPAYRMYVTGAVGAIRRSFWEKHHYDENLTMSCEDTDICLKAWLSGNRVFYDPEITAIHEEGATRGASTEEKKKRAPWVVKKEQESCDLFESRYKDADFWNIDKELNELNRVLHPELPVAFVRNAGMGDVLLTLPIYRYLELKQRGNIGVVTQMLEVFRGEDPKWLTNQIDQYAWSGCVNLDLAYERRRNGSIRNGYFAVAREMQIIDDPEFFPHTENIESTAFDETLMRRQVHTNDWNKPYAVVHVKDGIGPKSMSVAFWAELIELIQKHLGLVVVLVGGDTKEFSKVQGEGLINLTHKTNLHGLHAILKKAVFFVGVDSAPLHVADGTCPAVGIFTFTDPQKIVSDKVIPVVTNAECRGCHHRRQGTPVDYACEFDDFRKWQCSYMVTPVDVFMKCKEIVEKNGKKVQKEA